jgi:hypothetical protein
MVKRDRQEQPGQSGEQAVRGEGPERAQGGGEEPAHLLMED